MELIKQEGEAISVVFGAQRDCNLQQILQSILLLMQSTSHFTPGVTAGFTLKPLTSLVLATSQNTIGDSDEEEP